MEQAFISVLNRSINISYLILAIFALRLVFRDAPKKLFLSLWTLTFVLLLNPVVIESGLSVIPSSHVIPITIIQEEKPFINSGFKTADEFAEKVSFQNSLQENSAKDYTSGTVLTVLAWVWVVGSAAMLFHFFVNAGVFYHRIKHSDKVGERLYSCDRIDTPFVFGVIRPSIYIPGTINEADRKYIIAHERIHIRRRDSLIKIVCYFLLSVFWFNPLMWAAYVCFSFDLESTCDERVIDELGEGEKTAYAHALINCATKKSSGFVPLFSEEKRIVKKRIQNIMRYQKRKRWRIVADAAVFLVIAIAFGTIPKDEVKAYMDGYGFEIVYYSADEECFEIVSEYPEDAWNEQYLVDEYAIIFLEAIQNAPFIKSSSNRELSFRFIDKIERKTILALYIDGFRDQIWREVKATELEKTVTTYHFTL